MAGKVAQKLKASDFVHLHNHSHHSLLDGLQKIEPMLDRVKERGMDAVALTDHGTLSGAIDFYKTAKAKDLKPIIGMETYVANGSHRGRDPQKDKHRYHLILLAMNNKGYENLMQLSTIANLHGYYYKPRVDRDLLEEYNEGLIATSGCASGEIGEAIKAGLNKEAEEIAKWYKGVFKGRFYLELQDHDWDLQKKINNKLLDIGKKLDIPCIVTGDAHYLRHEDQEAHEALLCVQTGSLLKDEKRMSLKNVDVHLKDPKDIIKRWSKYPELIKNTKEIADRCDVSIELGKILIPRFDLPAGKTDKQVLELQTYQGLAWRYGNAAREETQKMTLAKAKQTLGKEVLQRAAYELGILDRMGFNSYFLIVADFINWGKDKGIVFGPGRGSAAGSIVSYALNITNLDPLKYDLLFERFLNPDRISMPDIDIDIQDNRRDEVIEYCVNKYGEDHVAHIATFGTMAARNAIRDVARVLDVPYAEADRLAKMVPPPVQGRHIPLETSIKQDPELKAEYENNETAKRVIDLAVKMEGTIRSHGVHAAGVVISPDKIVKYTPLEVSQKGVIATQYSMGPIEDLGLLKMDFLGLSNLTIIKNALRIIKKVYKEDIDISQLPLDDEKTFKLLADGATTGVFQLESSGMKRYLKELTPNEFDDIIAMVALYRPGPLTAGLTQKYIDRKIGKEKVTYDHDTMVNALKNTYGVLIYQEQIMQIVTEMCGLSGGRGYTLLKAVGKKKRDLMATLKQEVIDGAVKNNVDKKIAEQFWKDLEGFADYAFNKSHAACYGLIAYQTAYLKSHYPNAFMAALMTSDYDDTDRLTIEISECRHMGLEVVAPDVNQSFVEFAVVPGSNQIRYGMAAIKNVGIAAVEEILRARKDGGSFKSIEDFARRVSTKSVNRKAWESLIKSGAFDSLEPNRKLLLENLDSILAFASKVQKEAESGQTDLFGGSVETQIQPVLDLQHAESPTNDRDKLSWEKELLGVYLSSHPLDKYRAYLDEQTMPLNQLKPELDGKSAEIGGIISSVKAVLTKSNSKMAFVRVEGLAGEIEAIVFPGQLSGNEEIWQEDKIVHISGKFTAKDRDGRINGDVKVIADKAVELTPDLMQSYLPIGKSKSLPKVRKRPSHAPSYSNSRHDDRTEIKSQEKNPMLFIHVRNPDNNELLRGLKNTLDKYPGDTEVVIVLDSTSRQAIRLPFKVDAGNGLKDELVEMLSEKEVVLQ